jgi:hypothetical protein
MSYEIIRNFFPILAGSIALLAGLSARIIFLRRLSQRKTIKEVETTLEEQSADIELEEQSDIELGILKYEAQIEKLEKLLKETQWHLEKRNYSMASKELDQHLKHLHMPRFHLMSSLWDESTRCASDIIRSTLEDYLYVMPDITKTLIQHTVIPSALDAIILETKEEDNITQHNELMITSKLLYYKFKIPEEHGLFQRICNRIFFVEIPISSFDITRKFLETLRSQAMGKKQSHLPKQSLLPGIHKQD